MASGFSGRGPDWSLQYQRLVRSGMPWQVAVELTCEANPAIADRIRQAIGRGLERMTADPAVVQAAEVSVVGVLADTTLPVKAGVSRPYPQWRTG